MNKQNIVVKDGSATPVDVTLEATQGQIGDNPTVWELKTKGPAGVSAGYSILTHSIRGSKTFDRSMTKFDYKVVYGTPSSGSLPSGTAPVITAGIKSAIIKLDCAFPSEFTIDQKRDAVKIALNSFNTAQVVDSVINASPLV